MEVDAAAQTADVFQKPGAQLERLMEGVMTPDESDRGAGRLIKAFRLMAEAKPVHAKIVKASRARTLPKGHPAELVEVALEKSVITEAEARQVREAREAQYAAYAVDSFTPEEYVGADKKAEVTEGFAGPDAPRPKLAA